jgi:hypothetical protein
VDALLAAAAASIRASLAPPTRPGRSTAWQPSLALPRPLSLSAAGW